MLILLVGCKKEPPPAKPNPPVPTAAMRVTVKHILQLHPTIDEPVPDAAVALYKTEADRHDQMNRVTMGTTDTTGEVFFDYLPDKFYYLTIEHPTYGYEEEEVSTPAGTTSLVEILYY